MKAQERKQASFDYVLADLIGRSVARVYNSSNKYPSISDAYPSLFDNEEVQAKREELEIERFKANLQRFTQSHNQKIQGVAKDND